MKFLKFDWEFLPKLFRSGRIFLERKMPSIISLREMRKRIRDSRWAKRYLGLGGGVMGGTGGGEVGLEEARG